MQVKNPEMFRMTEKSNPFVLFDSVDSAENTGNKDHKKAEITRSTVGFKDAINPCNHLKNKV